MVHGMRSIDMPKHATGPRVTMVELDIKVGHVPEDPSTKPNKAEKQVVGWRTEVESDEDHISQTLALA
ncbi:putative LRR receptor-like serine/threonine-protein [Sesbania bispinosa]|nr:putative LRR receptor-like serine/threonine-protein [Sesbania bispinosa]